jgi:prolyl-tRNA editing enzyme YbaK/EbsC (Cys-tRNA(Pro) deacylase)
MSKSVRRVEAALEAAGIAAAVREMAEETRTAEQAAAAVGVTLDQIVKSIIFRGEASGEAVLFLTAGGNRVDGAKASALAGEALGRADADLVRSQTGFAIGGVAPVGRLAPIRAWCDARLLDFEVVWAAAGTPRHVFPIAPDDLLRICGGEIGDFTADSKAM